MKIIIQYSILLYFFTVSFVIAQDNNIKGFWEFADYEAEIEVSCDCTAEEKAMATAYIYESIDAETNEYMVSDYVEFATNNTIEGTLMDTEIEGTYTQNGKTITLFYGENDIETYELVTSEEERILVNHTAGDIDNPIYVKRIETSDFGWIEVAFLNFTITLKEFFSFS